LKSYLVDKLKDSAADGKSKVVHKSVGLGRIHGFMLIMGRVWLVTSLVGSGKETGPTFNSEMG